MIRISEKLSNLNFLEYIKSTLSEAFSMTCIAEIVSSDSERCYLTVNEKPMYTSLVIGEILSKIADVITIGYKYSFLSKMVKCSGLKLSENELFLTGVIAADYPDDKEYVLKKLEGFTDVAIDGFYNFRIKNLRKKWEEVSAMLPKTFEKEDLTEFFSYMQAESDKKVYLDKNSLYDEHFKKLDLSTLLSAEGDIIKEIILSNPAEIIVKRNSFCGETELSGIKEYYGKCVRFA